MAASPSRHARTTSTYLIGYVLALVLTIIPFGLVATRAMSTGALFAVIAVAAVVQVLVHLRFFLHLDMKASPRDRLAVIALAAILIFIMIGGSVWIMLNLHSRMMGL